MAAGYLNNDNVLFCTVKDIDGAEDSGATVSAAIRTKAGASVETGIAMPWVAARSRYEGQPDEGLWSRGQRLDAVISVTGTGGAEGEIIVPIDVARREA